MSYKLPGVTVNQVLLRSSQELSDAELFACIVGPLYRVVKAEKVLGSIPVFPYTPAYPKLDEGSIVEISSVKLTVTNGKVKVMTARADGNFTAGTDTVKVTGANFASVKPGDMVVVPENRGTYIVKSASGDTIVFTSKIYHTITLTGTAVNFNIFRAYATYETDKDFVADPFKVTITAIEDDNNFPFVEGEVGLSYRALRKDLTGFYKVSSIDALKADMETDELNPLGFYISNIMLPASGGKTVVAYITNGESADDYYEAYEYLLTRQEPYLLTALTTQENIVKALSAHAITASSPDNSRFRVALVTTPLVTEKELSTFTIEIKLP